MKWKGKRECTPRTGLEGEKGSGVVCACVCVCLCLCLYSMLLMNVWNVRSSSYRCAFTVFPRQSDTKIEQWKVENLWFTLTSFRISDTCGWMWSGVCSVKPNSDVWITPVHQKRFSGGVSLSSKLQCAFRVEACTRLPQCLMISLWVTKWEISFPFVLKQGNLSCKQVD